jgi:hypothetical protein
MKSFYFIFLQLLLDQKIVASGTSSLSDPDGCSSFHYSNSSVIGPRKIDHQCSDRKKDDSCTSVTIKGSQQSSKKDKTKQHRPDLHAAYYKNVAGFMELVGILKGELKLNAPKGLFNVKKDLDEQTRIGYFNVIGIGIICNASVKVSASKHAVEFFITSPLYIEEVKKPKNLSIEKQTSKFSFNNEIRQSPMEFLRCIFVTALLIDYILDFHKDFVMAIHAIEESEVASWVVFRNSPDSGDCRVVKTHVGSESRLKEIEKGCKISKDYYGTTNNNVSHGGPITKVSRKKNSCETDQNIFRNYYKPKDYNSPLYTLTVEMKEFRRLTEIPKDHKDLIAARVYKDIKSFLDMIHQKGFVHGDVRCQNILAANVDKNGIPENFRLVDFELFSRCSTLKVTWCLHCIPDTIPAWRNIPDNLEAITEDDGNPIKSATNAVVSVKQKPIEVMCQCVHDRRQLIYVINEITSSVEALEKQRTLGQKLSFIGNCNCQNKKSSQFSVI